MRIETLQLGFIAPPVNQDIVTMENPRRFTNIWVIWLNSLIKRFTIHEVAFRLCTGDTQVTLADCSLWFSIQASAKCTLLNASQVQGRIFYIKNDALSGDTVTMAAALNRLIDNAAADTFTLAAGQSLTLQSNGTNWNVLAQV